MSSYYYFSKAVLHSNWQFEVKCPLCFCSESGRRDMAGIYMTIDHCNTALSIEKRQPCEIPDECILVVPPRRCGKLVIIFWNLSSKKIFSLVVLFSCSSLTFSSPRGNPIKWIDLFFINQMTKIVCRSWFLRFQFLDIDIRKSNWHMSVVITCISVHSRPRRLDYHSGRLLQWGLPFKEVRQWVLGIERTRTGPRHCVWLPVGNPNCSELEIKE